MGDSNQSMTVNILAVLAIVAIAVVSVVHVCRIAVAFIRTNNW